MPMAAPTRKPTGLAAILQGMGLGQDPTQIRRGLGDALMGVGAIGLGQDPFRALATVRQQRFQQQRAEQEDVQRQEDIQREGSYRKEDMETRQREIAEKLGFEREKIGIDQQNRAQDLAREDQRFGIEFGEKQRQFNEGIAVDRGRLGLAQAEADEKKRQKALHDKVMLGLADELGLAPMTTALLKSGVPELQQEGLDQAEMQMGMGADTEKEREIQGLMARGFDRAQAEDIAYDRIGFTADPVHGGLFKTNRGAGTAVPVEGTLPGAGQPPPPPMQLSGRGQLSQDLQKATGAQSNVEDLINRTVGQAMPGTPFPETADARQRVELFERTAQEALVNNPRFPVAEQQHVRSMIPSAGDWLQDPDNAERRVANLASYLSQKQSANAQTLATATISKDERARLMDQNASISRVLTMMGAGGEGDGTELSDEELINKYK